jgi:homoserine kinase
MAERAAAFAPASIGNVAVGFDMLGLAIDGVGDRVEARRSKEAGISIDVVYGLDGEIHPYLPSEPGRNTASIAAQHFWALHGDGRGAALTIRKGVPLQSGMGSSAASAVAAVVAVNALIARPRPLPELLPFALEGERFASGGLHADNVAPSLLGGLVLCPAALLPETVRLPVPTGISAVILHPELQVNTAQARKSLQKHYAMDQWLEQQGFLAVFVAACAADDHDLIRRSLKDVLIEPQRTAAVPCFDGVRDAALQAGSLGCSLSGSGPSIFALVASSRAANTAMAMEQACRRQGIDCQSWISSLAAPGARVED